MPGSARIHPVPAHTSRPATRSPGAFAIWVPDIGRSPGEVSLVHGLAPRAVVVRAAAALSTAVRPLPGGGSGALMGL